MQPLEIAELVDSRRMAGALDRTTKKQVIDEMIEYQYQKTAKNAGGRFRLFGDLMLLPGAPSANAMLGGLK